MPVESPTAASKISFLLNGEVVHAKQLSAQTTLLDFLRDRGLTGAKEGCAEGECGACTVILLKDQGSTSAYLPVNSCLLFLPMIAGQEVLTVESLARNGCLAEAQRAMVDHGGSQCGYCTPGFVMSLFAEQYRRDRQGPCNPHALAGNLCRCTGYRSIQNAALSLGPPLSDEFSQRLRKPTAPLAPLDYVSEQNRFSRPASILELVSIWKAHPDARLIAGGTDLVVESNLRDRYFDHLISVEAIGELKVFQETENGVTIGSAVPLAELATLWANPPQFVTRWLELFASPLIRNRATLGGNLATASPIGDAAVLLLALDAELYLHGPDGDRTVPLHKFFTGYRRTVLEPAELITAIYVPKPFPSRVNFYKVAKRRVDDISTVAAAFALNFDDSGRVNHVRFAYGGVASTSVRAIEAEDEVLGRQWTERVLRRAQDAVARSFTPITDHRGSAEYRRAMAQNLLEKYWRECQEANS